MHSIPFQMKTIKYRRPPSGDCASRLPLDARLINSSTASINLMLQIGFRSDNLLHRHRPLLSPSFSFNRITLSVIVLVLVSEMTIALSTNESCKYRFFFGCFDWLLRSYFYIFGKCALGVRSRPTTGILGVCLNQYQWSGGVKKRDETRVMIYDVLKMKMHSHDPWAITDGDFRWTQVLINALLFNFSPFVFISFLFG